MRVEHVLFQECSVGLGPLRWRSGAVDPVRVPRWTFVGRPRE